MRGPFPLEELGLDPRMLDITLHEMERYAARLEESEEPEEEPDEDAER